MNRKNNEKILVKLKDLMIYPFYFNLDEKYLKLLIKNGLEKSENFKNLSKKIGCCPDTLKNLNNGKRKFIKAEFLNNLLKLLDIDVKEVERYVLFIKRGCCNKKVRIRLPIRSSPNLALLLAKSFGDGGISSDLRFHYTNNQLDLIEEAINAVNNSIGETECKIHKRIERKTYEIKFCSSIGYILSIIGAPIGPKINQKFEIPNWILDDNKKIKSFFLRGIFDDESTVSISQNKGTKRILLAMGKVEKYESSLRDFLWQIQKLLLEFNVNTGRLHVQQRYSNKVIVKFGIYRKTNFENFEKYISFTHKNKKNIIKCIINSYVDRSKAKKNILRVVKDSINPLTTSEIATLNQVSKALAWFHLNDLFKKGMVKKIEGKPCVWF